VLDVVEVVELMVVVLDVLDVVKFMLVVLDVFVVLAVLVLVLVDVGRALQRRHCGQTS
jgi:hypothetical protein